MTKILRWWYRRQNLKFVVRLMLMERRRPHTLNLSPSHFNSEDHVP
jgi:hypothetical protein